MGCVCKFSCNDGQGLNSLMLNLKEPFEETFRSQKHLNRNLSAGMELTHAEEGSELNTPTKVDSPAVLEGELLKYSPGISNHYVSRWCQLTKTCFRYYKNEYQSYYSCDKPFVSIPLSNIKYVSQSHFPVYDDNEKKLKYQFEIYCYEEDESVKLSRLNQPPFDKSLVYKACAFEEKDCVQEGKLMKKPLRIKETQPNHQQSTNEESWTYREFEWYASEKRLLFCSESNEEAKLWVKSINKLLV